MTASLLFPVPWDWVTDPRWMVVGNLLFWPTYFVYVIVMDKVEVWQRKRRWKAKQHA